MELIFVMLIGAVAAVLANRNIAVFNDGLRPIVSEHIEGNLNRRELGLTAFAMSFGLVIGFGIPFTLSASIILVHSILLGTDIIGLVTPKNRWGTPVAAAIGAAYGWALLLGLVGFVNLFDYLPVNFLEPIGEVGTHVVVTFMAFPAFYLALLFCVVNGVSSFSASAILPQLAESLNTGEYLTICGNAVELNQECMALIVGMIFLFYCALQE